MDGILGIGRGDTASDSAQIMSSLLDAKLIGSALYGIHLSRAHDGVADGELNLGAVNTGRFSGALNWLDCEPNSAGFWEIALSDASVDSKDVGLDGKTGIMDTGTSYILMPPDDARAIHALIPGYAQSGEMFSVPCDTKTALAFAFGDQRYNISTADWLGGKLDSGLCRSNIVGRQTFNSSQWLIGDVFLKNVYSVFDFEKNRVGLGLPATEGEESSESSGSSSSPTPTPTSTAAKTSAAAGATQTAAVEGSADPSSSAVAESQGQSNQQGGVGLVKAPFVLALGAVVISLFA
jgi:hypothetical protein